MTTISTTPTAAGDHHGNHHDPHLAHHFDNMEQQYRSNKLGMWTFLATEILMFGGLFCAYGVYRHNHPEVFAFAHEALDRRWGAINTVVLITSSLTMAWAVRAAQLGEKGILCLLLSLTLLGGAGFMGIKSIEYKTKWEHHLFAGKYNVYSKAYTGTAKPYVDLLALKEGDEEAAQGLTHEKTKPLHTVTMTPLTYVDPNAGTPDAAKIRANFAEIPGLSNQAAGIPEEHLTLKSLSSLDQSRINAFFSAYFLMTGLHGIHVLVGMGLIFWILRRSVSASRRGLCDSLGITGIGLFAIYLGFILSVHGLLVFGAVLAGLGLLGAVISTLRSHGDSSPGEFGPRYFAPVDLVGLYWHLVDLIWIFLFPLLYLIH